EISPQWRRSSREMADYRQLLDRFLKEQGHTMAEIRRHISAGEREEAMRLAHDLKGVAGLVGAKAVSAAAARLERSLRGGAEEVSLAVLAAGCEAELSSLAAAVAATPQT
ncbi:MAG TPA: Hpt domain-containing protein, partial [Rhodocyclaceae bacterium]|nr:Hpt domain-containing protein [Rhodocyclaceae bacterium]